jgi:hypothetical protein
MLKQEDPVWEGDYLPSVPGYGNPISVGESVYFRSMRDVALWYHIRYSSSVSSLWLLLV